MCTRENNRNFLRDVSAGTSLLHPRTSAAYTPCNTLSVTALTTFLFPLGPMWSKRNGPRRPCSIQNVDGPRAHRGSLTCSPAGDDGIAPLLALKEENCRCFPGQTSGDSNKICAIYRPVWIMALCVESRESVIDLTGQSMHGDDPLESNTTRRRAQTCRRRLRRSVREPSRRPGRRLGDPTRRPMNNPLSAPGLRAAFVWNLLEWADHVARSAIHRRSSGHRGNPRWTHDYRRRR